MHFSLSCIVNGRKCADWCIFWSTSAVVASNIRVKTAGLIAMYTYKPYKSDDISCKNTFSVKKCGQVK